MKIVKHKGVFHYWPYCCAEQVGVSGILKGKNFLWLNWMFCFDDDPTKS